MRGSDANALRDSGPASESQEPDERPARILVVDDELSVAEVFEEFLADQGHEIAVASTGEEAQQIIPTLRPDIVLTDINLPGMSGLDVMRFAKRHDPETAVIVVTGHASAASAIEALRQGAYDYITKPFDLDEVQQIVERGLANRRLKAINRRLVEELRQKNEILQQHEQQLRESVANATAQLKRLYDVGMEVSANLELAPRLALICRKSATLCGAGAAIVFLVQPEQNDCYAAAQHGSDLPPLEDGQVHWLHRDSVLTPAVVERRTVRRATPPGTPPEVVSGLHGLTFQSLLAAPMVADGQVIGILAVFDKPEGFTDDDQSFLELFASQTAIAVRNSQLFEHTKSLDRLKSEFVAVVSHEIRTPLTSIKGAVELLQDGRYFKNTEQQAKLLTIAYANTERLMVLIKDILDFSKLESASLRMNLERQPIEPVIEQGLHNLQTLIDERHIDVQLNLAPRLPHVAIDAGRIAQVLTNLLSNAIKFSPPGGRIDVIVEPIDGEVQVSVRDRGEGIAPQDLAKLFRKFSQIDSSATRKAGGAGLGLVICKGIIERHGGQLWVESALGEGSTFFFTLPLAERTAAEQAAGL